MKKKKMIKFRLIILMVLCAGLLLGAWIVRGHLIHEPFRTMCVRLFRHPAESISLGQIIWEGVLPAEFYMAQ